MERKMEKEDKKGRGKGRPPKEEAEEKLHEQVGEKSPAVPETVDMKLSEEELNSLIYYDEEKGKYIAPCPVDGCGKVYESETKGFPFHNLRKHLMISHGVEMVEGGVRTIQRVYSREQTPSLLKYVNY